MPFVYSENSVSNPNEMPPANVSKLTARLLVMMRLVSLGAMLTIDCVHISWRSMVAIMAGPTKWRMNSGLAVVSTTPSSPQAPVISSDARTNWMWRWKMAG